MFGFDALVNLAATQVSHEADQNRAHSDMTWQAEFNAEQAQAASDRNFTNTRSLRQTAYQDTINDLKAAGLNPMLAMAHGPTSATGVSAQQATGGGVPGQYGGGPSGAPTSATYVAAAEIDKLHASAEKDRAEAEATRNTYPVNIELTQERVKETTANITKLIAEARTQTASAANLEQQTRNLKELVPQIRATVTQLGTLAALQSAQYDQVRKQTNLTDEEIRRLQQIIKANLPEVERRLKDLELPKAGMEAATHSTWIGALSAMLKALNPLAGLINIAR